MANNIELKDSNGILGPYGVRIDVVHARILAARIVHSILGGREGGHAPLIVFVPLVITRVHSTSLMCTKPYVAYMQSFK